MTSIIFLDSQLSLGYRPPAGTAMTLGLRLPSRHQLICGWPHPAGNNTTIEIETSTTLAELQRTDPNTKVAGEFSTKDCIFPPNAQNEFFSHRFSWEKNTIKWLVTCHGYINNKHNAELQWTDPGTKVTGEFSTMGHIFSPNVWNEFFIISIVLVGKKYTKMIGHMP